VAISVDAYWCNQAGGIWDAEHGICDFDDQWTFELLLFQHWCRTY
jgi:hypothetical protein